MVLDLRKMTKEKNFEKSPPPRGFEPIQNYRSKMDVLGPFSTLYEKIVPFGLKITKTKIFLLDPSISTILGLIFGGKMFVAPKWSFLA